MKGVERTFMFAGEMGNFRIGDDSPAGWRLIPNGSLQKR